MFEGGQSEKVSLNAAISTDTKSAAMRSIQSTDVYPCLKYPIHKRKQQIYFKVLKRWSGDCSDDRSSCRVTTRPCRSLTAGIKQHNLQRKMRPWGLKNSIDCLIQHTIFLTIEHQQNLVNLKKRKSAYYLYCTEQFLCIYHIFLFSAFFRKKLAWTVHGQRRPRSN